MIREFTEEKREDEYFSSYLRRFQLITVIHYFTEIRQAAVVLNLQSVLVNTLNPLSIPTIYNHHFVTHQSYSFPQSNNISPTHYLIYIFLVIFFFSGNHILDINLGRLLQRLDRALRSNFRTPQATFTFFTPFHKGDWAVLKVRKILYPIEWS